MLAILSYSPMLRELSTRTKIDLLLNVVLKKLRRGDRLAQLTIL
jgi:hypothetical protein